MGSLKLKTLKMEIAGIVMTWQFTSDPFEQDIYEKADMLDAEQRRDFMSNEVNSLGLIDAPFDIVIEGEGINCTYHFPAQILWDELLEVIELGESNLRGDLDTSVFWSPIEQYPYFEFVHRGATPSIETYQVDGTLVANMVDYDASLDPDARPGGMHIYLPIGGFGAAFKLYLDVDEADVFVTYLAWCCGLLSDVCPKVRGRMNEDFLLLEDGILPDETPEAIAKRIDDALRNLDENGFEQEQDQVPDGYEHDDWDD